MTACGSRQEDAGPPPTVTASVSPVCARTGGTISIAWTAEHADACDVVGVQSGLPVSGSTTVETVAALLISKEVALVCYRGARPGDLSACAHACSWTDKKQICTGPGCTYFRQAYYNTDNFGTGPAKDALESSSGCSATTASSGGGTTCAGKCSRCLDSCRGIGGCCCGSGCICDSDCTSACGDNC
jgi:hypothetical protein